MFVPLFRISTANGAAAKSTAFIRYKNGQSTVQSTGKLHQLQFEEIGLSRKVLPIAEAKELVVMLFYGDDSQIKGGSYRIMDSVKTTTGSPEAVLLIRPLLQQAKENLIPSRARAAPRK